MHCITPKLLSLLRLLPLPLLFLSFFYSLQRLRLQ